MKRAVRQIEKAIHSLYAIDTPYRAEHFLVESTAHQEKQFDAALLIRPGASVEVGIYFSPIVRTQIENIPLDQTISTWPQETLNAFSIATEEISHFHYFVFHSEQGRPVSQLELEIQGEIDRFLVCLFSHQDPEKAFEPLVDSLFENYRLRHTLNQEQVARYELANSLAKNFILKHLRKYKAERFKETMFRFLRTYYRMAAQDKLEVAGRK